MDEPVRDIFGIPQARIVRYSYGFTDTDLAYGECRDEQAWMIEHEYSSPEAGKDTLQLVTVRLRPRVSRREARKALGLALGEFPEKGKGRRPSIRERERDYMREAFELAEKLVGKLIPPRQAVEITQLLLSHVGISRSESTIYKEHQGWRAEKGRRIKRYVTDRREQPRSTRRS